TRVEVSPRVLALLAPLPSIVACSAPSPPAVQIAPPPPEPPAPVASAAPRAPECPVTCSGHATPELAWALRDAARKATRCYNRILRTGDVEGSMMVKLGIDPSGAVCRTAIETSGPGMAVLEPCVRALFEGQRFPPGAEGCLNVNIPISFSIKENQDGGADAAAQGSPRAPGGSP